MIRISETNDGEVELSNKTGSITLTIADLYNLYANIPAQQRWATIVFRPAIPAKSRTNRRAVPPQLREAFASAWDLAAEFCDLDAEGNWQVVVKKLC